MRAGGARSVDVALVGGGLANALIALRLAERRPELRVVLPAGPGLGISVDEKALGAPVLTVT